MPKVSIIIPAYNAAEFLRETVESVLASSFKDFELIIIDDGSSDGTGDIARGIMDSRIRVFSRDNQGMSASRNFGINASSSELIALLDADDIWHQDKLSLQVSCLSNKPEFSFCYTDFQKWRGEPTNLFFEPIEKYEIAKDLSGWIYPKMIFTNFALPSSLLFRRTAWASLGPFLCENQQTDDWEYLVRACRQFKFVKINNILVLYRQHSASLSRRPSLINHTEIMRDTLIQRYQYSCPNGGMVDQLELKRRRYLGQRHFADTHLVAGDFRFGLMQFWKLLRTGPFRFSTALNFLKSLRLRAKRAIKITASRSHH